MAKVKVADYIETLRAIIAESSGDDLEKRFHNFLQLLASKKQLDLIDQILAGTQEALDRQAGNVRATVRCQRTPSNQLQSEIIAFLTEKYHAQKVILEFRTDLPTPGIIILARGERYDWSFDRQLKEFNGYLQAA